MQLDVIDTTNYKQTETTIEGSDSNFITDRFITVTT